MQHTVTVTQFAGTTGDWRMKCLNWRDADDRHPVEVRLVFQKKDGAFVGKMDLADGVYSLVCDLFSGTKLKVELDPPSPLFQPEGLEWPVEIEGTAPVMKTRLLYFEVRA